jgi:hypothetical protein
MRFYATVFYDLCCLRIILASRLQSALLIKFNKIWGEFFFIQKGIFDIGKTFSINLDIVAERFVNVSTILKPLLNSFLKIKHFNREISKDCQLLLIIC